VKKVYSAGGIVYRTENKKIFFLLIKHNKAGHWSFPKGHIGDKILDETIESAALREVSEEGGVVAEIVYNTPFINSYFLVEDKVKAKKTVKYFLMRYVTGSLDDHDNEVSEAEFVEYSHGLTKLTYDIDKKILQKTYKIVKKIEQIN